MQNAPGLYSLGDKTGGYVRAFLLDDGQTLTLIDTLRDKEGRLVLEALQQLGKKPGDITRIILTHARPSHLGGLAALKAATGARVYCHEWETDVVAKESRSAQTHDARAAEAARGLSVSVGLVLGLGTPQPCEVDEHLKDGDHIGPLTVMGAPGHTPGSLTFWWPERKTLFSGDIVSTWPENALGWPAITLDNKENRDSVGKLCDMVTAELVCVGHGDPVVEGGAEFMRNLFDQGLKQ
jgi:glyoxylase-like metal-dependent hydrolase (beta-lactamase superfamily II)